MGQTNSVQQDVLKVLRQYRLVGKGYVDYKQTPVESLSDLYTKASNEVFEGLVNTVIEDESASGATREYVYKLISGTTYGWEPLYYTPAQVDARIGQIAKIKLEYHDKDNPLPEVGEENVLYLFKVEGKDYCIEYIWLKAENRYEVIGTTEFDPSAIWQAISANTLAISAETIAREQAISAETVARIAAIEAEAAAREQAISAETINRTAAIAAEASAREQAISAETIARTEAINIEISARTAADTALDNKKQDKFAVGDGLLFSGSTETENLGLNLDMIPYTEQEIREAIKTGNYIIL